MFHCTQNELQDGIHKATGQRAKVRLLDLDAAARPSLPQDVEAWKKDAGTRQYLFDSAADHETERARLSCLLHFEAALLNSSGEAAIATVLALFSEPSWSALTRSHSALYVRVNALPPLLLTNESADAAHLTVLHVVVEAKPELEASAPSLLSAAPSPRPCACACACRSSRWASYGALGLGAATLLAVLLRR